MDPSVCKMILYAITTIGVVVWLLGLRFVVRSAGAARRSEGEAEQVRFNAPSEANIVAGTAEVEGEPALLSKQAAAILAEGRTNPPLGPVRVLKQTDAQVVFETARGGHRAAQPLRRGEIRFAQLGGGRTAVDYAADVSAHRGLLVGAMAVQLLGLVALVVGFLLIWTYAIPSNDPAVRGQVFQMVQVVHFLWPPFLLAGLYRMRFRMARAALDTLIQNLPYFGQ